jgi:hypothetical protein
MEKEKHWKLYLRYYTKIIDTLQNSFLLLGKKNTDLTGEWLFISIFQNKYFLHILPHEQYRLPIQMEKEK